MNKVLHITNWYPNKWNPNEAVFIKEHFDACNNYVEQDLWHIQVRNEGSYFRYYSGDYSKSEHYIVVDTKIKIHRLQEIVTLLLLIVLRIKLGKRCWDVTNVHIAYPLLRFTRTFQYLFGKSIVITEHWSAFRNNFFLPRNSKAAKRIANIFSFGLPLIAVSKALVADIVRFVGHDNFLKYIIPNVVNPDIFYPERHTRRNSPIFLMVAAWNPIKRPLLAMKAFAELLNHIPEAKLRIIGSGPQFKEMREYVKYTQLENCIELLGPMDKLGIAMEMRQADCFLHASDYETFSVVCAEAISCGLPVIASNVGGIPEFIKDEKGILVENNLDNWTSALIDFSNGNILKKTISENEQSRFHPKSIGKQFEHIYDISIASSNK